MSEATARKREEKEEKEEDEEEVSHWILTSVKRIDFRTKRREKEISGVMFAAAMCRVPV